MIGVAPRCGCSLLLGDSAGGETIGYRSVLELGEQIPNNG